MPRTEVYQLRLTSEEKAKLASIARERTLSIAQMIRSDYGLDTEVMILRNRTGKTTRGVIADLSVPAEEFVADMGEIHEKLARKLADPKRFKQMVARLQAKMPQEQAEEEARKRLGME